MPQLPNCLLSQRKRLALSQDEVAFLMGTHGGAGISRYEQLAQRPTLETALALEVILQKPAKELFAGLFGEIQQRVAARAKVLTYRKDQGKPSRRAARKRRSLENIINPQSNNLKQI
jgi:transcriptional regulator with XRE-family HTH domain